MDRIYGLKRIHDNPLFDKTLRNTGVLSSDQAQVVCSMLYDVSFDIHDHYAASSTNPLNTVAVHPREDYWELTGLYHTIMRYDQQDIKGRFGLSLTEYLDLPRDIIQMLTEIGDRANKRLEAIEAQAQQGAGAHERTLGNAWRHIRK